MSIPGITPAIPQRVPSGYDSIWSLFTDWCTVTGADPLPAEPGTVIAFLGRWSLRPVDDALLCGQCAIARWLRVVDLAVTKISTGLLKAAVGKAHRLTDESPHLCRSTKKLSEATMTAPLFSPINQWGALPFLWVERSADQTSLLSELMIIGYDNPVQAR